MAMNIHDHPCFNSEVRGHTARIHLPVAPKCNVQCNFCDRAYDCVNESRPGVASTVLSPFEAARYFDLALERNSDIAVAGIAGPGDPFANPEETLATLELIRERHPEKLLCVATNGLALPDKIGRIGRLDLSHVTVTVNAVAPEIGARIYAWVRFGPKVYRGCEGAEILLHRQTEAVRLLKTLGVTVKINTVIIPGVNDRHVEEIACRMASLGADIQNCIPVMPVKGTPFEHIEALSSGDLGTLREAAGKYLPQMSHCSRCRADAYGLLGCHNQEEVEELLERVRAIKPSPGRPYLAVASREGILVNCHLGEASELWVTALEDGRAMIRERRPAPRPGSGNSRWEDMARILDDCFAVLVSDCGPNPKRILEARGIRVLVAEGLVSEIAKPLLEGRGLPRVYQTVSGRCGRGASCAGSGMGCGA
jgi:nitrogen fixation protein NifB